MPLISIDIEDLEKLIGKRLSMDEIVEYITTLKGEYEGIEEGHIIYEATHDRPDLFSCEGLARSIRGLAEIELGLPSFKVENSDVSVIVDNVYYRPYIACAIIRNVVLNEEAVRQIMQLQEKLHMTYCRNRRKASIGVYDFDTIRPPIRYYLKNRDEVKFRPLEWEREATAKEILTKHPKGVEYGKIIAEYKEVPLLIDSNGQVLSMPPIINSEETKVTENTRNIFIDVTGTDDRLVNDILKIMVSNVAERSVEKSIMKVSIQYGTIRKTTPNMSIEEIKVERRYINENIGLDLSIDEIEHFLLMMRYGIAYKDNESIVVRIPPYRIDVLHPIDLVEDVAMAYGYNRLEPILPTDHYTIGKAHPLEVFTRTIREIMCGLGFQEVASYMLTNKEVQTKFMKLENYNRIVELENPISDRFTVVRFWLIPDLLMSISQSKGSGYPIEIFEVGDVAWIDEEEENRTGEERRLAAAIASTETTLVDGLVKLNALIRTLGLKVSYSEQRHDSFIEGRCGSILVNGIEVGIIGEIHPEVLNNFDISVPVVAFEISLNKLLEIYRGIS